MVVKRKEKKRNECYLYFWNKKHTHKKQAVFCSRIVLNILTGMDSHMEKERTIRTIDC